MTQYLERYALIDYLIRGKKTGTPVRFAKKLSMSRSNLYLYIGSLKQMGAPIAYNRSRSTFYYNSPFNLADILNPEIGLQIKQ